MRVMMHARRGHGNYTFVDFFPGKRKVVQKPRTPEFNQGLAKVLWNFHDDIDLERGSKLENYAKYIARYNNVYRKRKIEPYAFAAKDVDFYPPTFDLMSKFMDPTDVGILVQGENCQIDMKEEMRTLKGKGRFILHKVGKKVEEFNSLTPAKQLEAETDRTFDVQTMIPRDRNGLAVFDVDQLVGDGVITEEIAKMVGDCVVTTCNEWPHALKIIMYPIIENRTHHRNLLLAALSGASQKCLVAEVIPRRVKGDLEGIGVMVINPHDLLAEDLNELMSDLDRVLFEGPAPEELDLTPFRSKTHAENMLARRAALIAKARAVQKAKFEFNFFRDCVTEKDPGSSKFVPKLSASEKHALIRPKKFEEQKDSIDSAYLPRTRVAWMNEYDEQVDDKMPADLWPEYRAYLYKQYHDLYIESAKDNGGEPQKEDERQLEKLKIVADKAWEDWKNCGYGVVTKERIDHYVPPPLDENSDIKPTIKYFDLLDKQYDADTKRDKPIDKPLQHSTIIDKYAGGLVGKGRLNVKTMIPATPTDSNFDMISNNDLDKARDTFDIGKCVIASRYHRS